MNGLLIIIFVIGYLAIALEHSIRLNKAASALITGVLLWSVLIVLNPDKEMVNLFLMNHMGEISGILFFLLGAMVIVELVDAHDGFQLVSDQIKTTKIRNLLWIVSFITFFLSAVLDNLTTTIVMVTLMGKMVSETQKRLLFAGMIVIAANAGGAWSPLGDVTTTMLWIGGQITPSHIISNLLFPSLVCLLIPLIVLSFRFKGKFSPSGAPNTGKNLTTTRIARRVVFFSGIGALILVPVFKTVTHLPPFMGILMALGLMWIVTEIVHKGKDTAEKHPLSVIRALQRIDASSILFFLGILLAVAALETAGILHEVSASLASMLKSDAATAMFLGLLSSVVDNVPLVAATQGMYSLQQYPTDHFFWEFLAYSTGVGGSVLVIGSAAGVAAMGIEKIRFFWYMKNLSVLALLGFFGGALAYILQHQIFGN